MTLLALKTHHSPDVSETSDDSAFDRHRNLRAKHGRADHPTPE